MKKPDSKEPQKHHPDDISALSFPRDRRMFEKLGYMPDWLQDIQEEFGDAANIATQPRDQDSLGNHGNTSRMPSQAELKSTPCHTMIRKLVFAMTFDYDTAQSTGKPNWSVISEAVFEWFRADGAVFIRTSADAIFMYFRRKVYSVAAKDKNFKAMLHNVTKVSVTGVEMKTLISTFVNLAYAFSTLREVCSWLHTDTGKFTLYFNLNNLDDEILRISPGQVDRIKNGNNDEGVFLVNSQKIAPIHYHEDVDITDGMILLDTLITRHLTCPPLEREFLKLWIITFPLMDFAGIKPHARFQGSVGSGKTTASKLWSTLLYGQPQQKLSTIAANYSDASVNPLILLDNIETFNLDPKLIEFILTCCTGIARERRKPGTLSENITEHTKALINTTGVEPLAAHLTEIMSRTFVFDFDISNVAGALFNEARAIQEVRENRDIILSTIFKMNAIVLGWMQQGYQDQVRSMLMMNFGEYSKRRCNDYIAIMSLMRHAASVAIQKTGYLKDFMRELDPMFGHMIAAQEITNKQLVLDSNAIAACLQGILQEYHHAVVRQKMSSNGEMQSFQTSYKTIAELFREIGDDRFAITNANAIDLHAAMKKYAGSHGIEYTFKYASQLGQRIRSELTVLWHAGVHVEIGQDANNLKKYTIAPKPDCTFISNRPVLAPMRWGDA